MLRLFIFSFMAFATLSILPNQPLYAASGVGRVVYTSGPAWLERGSSREKMERGTIVLQNDSIITGLRGRAKVMMGDGSKIYIGTNSRISLRQYVIDNNKLKNATINMLWGKTRFFVNKLTSKKSSFRVRTSTAVLGVRGTEFIVSVPLPPKLPQGFGIRFRDLPRLPTRAVLFEGAIVVDSGKGIPQGLTPGYTADVDNQGITIRRTQSSDIDSHRDSSALPPSGEGSSSGSKNGTGNNEVTGEGTSVGDGKDDSGKPSQQRRDNDPTAEPEDRGNVPTPPSRPVPVPAPVSNLPRVDNVPTTNAIQNLGTSSDVKIQTGFVKP